MSKGIIVLIVLALVVGFVSCSTSVCATRWLPRTRR